MKCGRSQSIVCLKRKRYEYRKWVEKNIINAAESYVYVCVIDMKRLSSGQVQHLLFTATVEGGVA
jgi:hypothetical protein